MAAIKTKRAFKSPKKKKDRPMRNFATNLFVSIAAISISGSLFTAILV